MLRLAFAQMGFETVIDLDMAPFQHWQASHLCLLGLR
jgi:hypothetical protein